MRLLRAEERDGAGGILDSSAVGTPLGEHSNTLLIFE